MASETDTGSDELLYKNYIFVLLSHYSNVDLSKDLGVIMAY